MKIAIIVGTRPEIIKMGPIIHYCLKNEIPFFVLHSGQHYSYEMDKVFFENLHLPEPAYNLKSGSNDFRKQIGCMVPQISEILQLENPDFTLVEGDTNTVLASAMAANKLGLKLVHVEAGLRSHELAMIEEINRVITDHLSDILYPPTDTAKGYLLEEGIAENKIKIVGNTVIDALFENSKLSHFDITSFGIESKKYILLTMHRPELVDIKSRIESVLEGLERVSKKNGINILFPIHPRTEKMIKQFGLKIPKKIKIIKPLGYLDFISVQKHAALIITDSGGIQEEACALHIPCVTIRKTTERPETIEVGSNRLAGYNPEKIVKCVDEMIHKKSSWDCPYGDGTAAKNIIEDLLRRWEF